MSSVGGQFARIVNDVRLDFGDGKGTLGEVADRLLKIVHDRIEVFEQDGIVGEDPADDQGKWVIEGYKRAVADIKAAMH